MTQGYLVIDEGCQECGVGTVVMGLYLDEGEAAEAEHKREDEFQGWRDGGSCMISTYVVDIPKEKS